MKRFKKYWLYLLLALSISLTIVVINNMDEKAIPKVVNDINSGVIGAILTTIITLILLSNQTESQENLTKSSVVYEEKLKIFSFFLDTLRGCLEEGKFTAKDTTKIIHGFSLLRIHISPENSEKIERAISNIDSSFFFCDENRIPNLSRLTELYTELTNVFRRELYGENILSDLPAFHIESLKNVLYRPRISVRKFNGFDEMLLELKKNSKILHTDKNGIIISFDINEEIIESLSLLNDYIQKIARGISPDITFSYETLGKIINKTKYIGKPRCNIKYKKVDFAFFEISELKRSFVGMYIPKMKQVATFEIFETDTFEQHRSQIINEFQNAITEIEKNQK